MYETPRHRGNAKRLSEALRGSRPRDLHRALSSHGSLLAYLYALQRNASWNGGADFSSCASSQRWRKKKQRMTTHTRKCVYGLVVSTYCVRSSIATSENLILWFPGVTARATLRFLPDIFKWFRGGEKIYKRKRIKQERGKHARFSIWFGHF